MVVTIRNRLETSGDGTRPGLLSQESALQGAANAAETHANPNRRRDMSSGGKGGSALPGTGGIGNQENGRRTRRLALHVAPKFSKLPRGSGVARRQHGDPMEIQWRSNGDLASRAAAASSGAVLAVVLWTRGERGVGSGRGGLAALLSERTLECC